MTRDRSYQAAMRLAAENEGSRIAVMNFANAFQAGGGVVKGAGAQEECLCRTSTLYPLLYRKTLRDTFYKLHRTLKTPKATDALIYTEDVVICKTDEDLPQRMPREQWVNVDVITVAAPDLRDKSNHYAPLVGGGTFMKNAELFGYHVKRAIHVQPRRVSIFWYWVHLAAARSGTTRKWWREPIRSPSGNSRRSSRR